jgi:hypothetical protein
MCNLAQRRLIKPFTEVTGYGENDVRESCEHHQKDGLA